MITIGSALFAIKGFSPIAINSETRKGLGDGGFVFNYLRFGRVDDYVCELKIDGEYRNNFPFKKTVNCKIFLVIDPFKQRNSTVMDANSLQHRYYCSYEESRWDKFYHQDAEKLCNELVSLMERHLSQKTFDRLEKGSATIYFDRKDGYGEFSLSPGWAYTLLKPEEYGDFV